MTKVCRACGVARPEDSFEAGRATCRLCRQARNRRWYQENKERVLARQRAVRAPYSSAGHRWQVYGLSDADYSSLLDDQGGRCAACGDDVEELAVDHDHETGTVRGLLCRACNVAVGLFGDDPSRCHAAARYLRRSRSFGVDPD